MTKTYEKMKNLFLRQSYQDSWNDYEQSLKNPSFIKWDDIVLTASNETQADIYRLQIDKRLKNNLLPKGINYAVLPDPDGKRVGSGGATFNVLKYIAEIYPNDKNHFENRRILVIHSGGDSKRVPQYSAIGKLFSPIPRELPNGHASTLFDEFIIAMSGVPARFKEGMIVLSGDVLLLFNPLQIDFSTEGAVALSFKVPVETGKNHGVFLNDGQNNVSQFLHKQSEERLREIGAVNQSGFVDLDTGAILIHPKLLNSLYDLISSNGEFDNDKFNKFVNDRAKVSFYGDFLYPLAEQSTLENYYEEAPEGDFTDELYYCRTEIWNAVHEYNLKLLCMSPAQFIHFGTTKELLELFAQDVQDYSFLGWSNKVMTNMETGNYAAHTAYIGSNVQIKDNVYIENSFVLGNSIIGANSIISNLYLRDKTVTENIVMHGLALKQGSYVTRVYGIEDNPKSKLENGATFLNIQLEEFIEKNNLTIEDLWDMEDYSLWQAKLYCAEDTREASIDMAYVLLHMCNFTATEKEINIWKSKKRMSLCSSFAEADLVNIDEYHQDLENRIICSRFISKIKEGSYHEDAEEVFGTHAMNAECYKILMQDASESDFSLKIRICYAVSRHMKKYNLNFDNSGYDVPERKCFDTIQKVIYDNAVDNLPDLQNCRIARDRVFVELPVRVNWGGGWTDTPPYCIENGGVVLNAAISINGDLPIKVEVKKLGKLEIQFESQDVGVKGTVNSIVEIQDCHNPFDYFALHKAALIACGIIPLKGEGRLEDILERLGGGIYLSTQVIGIPKGSGLGTSSILAGACVKAIYEMLDIKLEDNELYQLVLCMEQIMSTGGGWQDQVGGLCQGIKMISTESGVDQKIKVEHVNISKKTMKELNERFALIYTGQRRLARNLLRDIVGSYIGNKPSSLEALKDMQPVAALMRFALERGNIDEFARLLSQHWDISKKLDVGSTNTCIDQILMSVEDLVEGKMICGAGGGGFLQVILKKGVSKEMVNLRLDNLFQDSGVGAWNSEFVM